MVGWTIGIGSSDDKIRKYIVVLFSQFFLLGRILFCLHFEPVMGRGSLSLSHRDGGMSTALSPALLRGQGMGLIVYPILASYCFYCKYILVNTF